MDNPLNDDRPGELLESVDDSRSISGGQAFSGVPQQPVVSSTAYESDMRVVHQSLFKSNKRAIALTITVIAFILLSGSGVLFLTGKKQTPAQNLNSASSGYGVVNVPLQGVQSGSAAQLGKLDRLDVNGQLQVSNTLVVSPTAAPKNATAGQIYYDKVANAPFYFNGTSFVSLAGATSSVTSLAGATGNISVGAGLQVTAGQLSLSPAISQSLSDGSVKTIQGQSGDIVFSAGNGISINGTAITNTGVTGVTGGAGLAVSQSGGVVSVSLPQQLGTSDTPTFAGVNLGTPLAVASGGTGLAASSLAANSVLITNADGTGYELAAPTAAGQCLIADGLNNNKVKFGSCTGATTNGVQGLADANGNAVDGTVVFRAGTNSPLSVIATSASDTMTIDLSYNSTNLQVAGGQLNTIQNINQTATPTFAGLALASGADKLTVTASPNGQQTLSIPSFNGNSNICINVASSCTAFQAAGSYQTAGSYVNLQTSTPGTAQTGNINVSGAIVGSTVTASSFNSYGALSLSAGGIDQSVTLQGTGAGLVIVKVPSFKNANGATYSFNTGDAAATNATICTSVGNCVGTSGGGVVSSGIANAIAVFGADGYHLANSILSQDAGATTLTVAGTTIAGNSALTVTAGGTNQDLTLKGSGTGRVVVKNPLFNNANGAAYNFSSLDASGSTSTICTTSGNCTGASGGGVVSAGTSNKIALFGADGYHLANSILSQDAGATTLTVAGTTVTGNGSLTISAGGTNQNLMLQGTGSGVVAVAGNLTVSGTVNGATITGGSLTGGAVSGGTFSGGTVSGGSLSSATVNGLNVSATAITAGGTSQNLMLQGSDGASVVIKNPSFNNVNGATYSFSASDANGSNATICTTAGNCTGSSGGGVVSSGTANSIPLFGTDGYHLTNSILSQNIAGTMVNIAGSLAATGTINGATISGGNISGGSFNGASITGGSLSSTAVNGLNVSGNAVSGNASGLNIAAGGTNQNLTLQGSGTGVVSVVGGLTASGNFTAIGTINGATISGGTLSAAAVNGLNVSATSITAGGTNQNLTLQGSGTGIVAVTGDFAATGTINGATISGGNISGGSFNGASITGGSLSGTEVNGLAVSGVAITGVAGLTVSAGGTNQALTLQGSGTGGVIIKVPSFKNANGATYVFDAADANGATATICTSAGNCNGGGGGVSSTGTSNTIALFGSDGNHLVNSILTQNVPGTAVTVNGNLATTGTINGATVSGGTVSGGTLSGGSVTGGTLSGTAVNGLNVSSTAISSTGALSISAGGTNQSLTLQGTGTGAVIIKNPSLQNSNGATYTFANDASGTSATICTSLGNCTGASGGGVVSAGTTNRIALFGADGYHLADSILAQDAGATTLTVAGSAITGTGALAISAGGTNKSLTLSATGSGSVIVNVPIFHNATGATYAFDTNDTGTTTATICTTAGNCTGSSGGGVVSTGSANTIALYGADGYHLVNSLLTQDAPATTVAIAGKISTTGTINGATISGGVVSGGTLSGGNISGGSLSATAVNGLNVSSNAIAASGIDQSLTLQGTGTGVVAVSGKLTTTNTINGATISGGTVSGGTLSGGSVTGGTLTSTAVNGLNVSSTGISSTGTTQSLTLQGTGGAAVIVKNPSFNNTNGATYNFANDANGTTSTICTTSGNCTGSSGGGVVSAGAANSIAVFTTDGYHLGNSLLSQDSPATTVTVSGKLAATGTINNATISGGTVSGGTLSGGSVTGGTLTSTTVNGLSVSGTAIGGTGALAISAGGANQNITLQATGTGVVSIASNLTTTGTINGATISGGTVSGGTLSGGNVSGGTLTAAAVNGLNVSSGALSGNAAGLSISAGGTNQTLTLQGTGTGVVNVAGNLTTTGTINTATISGGSLSASAVNGLNVSSAAVSSTGALSISAGGTNQNLSLQGTGTGVVSIKVPSFKNANNATYAFDANDAAGITATICTTVGNCVGGNGGGVASTGTANSIPVFSSDGYHIANSLLSQDAGATTVTAAGKLVATGTINGATISGGTLSGGTVSGGTLTGTTVNGLNASSSALSGNATGLSISAGGTNQTLTLQGTGTGVVNVASNLTTAGTINGATISGGTVSGGTLSGGTVSGGTLTGTTVNTLSVSGTAIGGTGALAISAGGLNQNLTLQGSGTGIVAVSGGLTVSTGATTISTLNVAGVVHNNASGTLSTSLIVNADLSTGNYTNITGVGTLTGGINISTGQTYKINNLDINASGTLSNVDYLNGSQTITGNKTFTASGDSATVYGALFKNATNSTTAFSIQNTAATVMLGVDTTNSKVAIGAAPTSGGQALQVTGAINATAGLYTGTGGTGTVRLDGSGNLSNVSIPLNSTVKAGTVAGVLYTDTSGVLQGLALSGNGSQCLAVNAGGTALAFVSCAGNGSGGGTGYTNGGSNYTSNTASSCGATAQEQSGNNSYLSNIGGPTLGICGNYSLDILTNNVSRLNISASGDVKIFSYNNSGSTEKFAIRTYNDGTTGHYFNALRVDTSSDYLGRVGIGLLVGTAPEVRLDIGGTVNGSGFTASNGGIQVGATPAPGLSRAPSSNAGSDFANGTGRIYFDAASGKFKVSENGGGWVNLVGSATSSPILQGGNNSSGATVVLGNTYANGNGGLLIGTANNNGAINNGFHIDGSGNYSFDKPYNDNDQYGFKINGSGTDALHVDTRYNVVSIGGLTTNSTSAYGALIVGGSGIMSTGGFRVGTGSEDVGIDATCSSSQQTIDGPTFKKGILVKYNGCRANNSDLAEAYNSSDALVPGELVMASGTSTTGVNRATDANGSTGLMGIVSTAPGQTLGTAQVPNGFPIALSGRVPTKVNTEGGAIKVGDKITISSVAGVGKKATGSGMIVGTAMEAYDGTGTGSIEVFVNLTYYANPDIDHVQGQSADFGDLNVSGLATIGTLHVTGDATIDGTLTVKAAIVGTLTVNGHIITRGDQPTIAATAAAGAGATVTVSGNDTAGTITVHTGATSVTNGDIASLTFAKAFDQAPHTNLTPTSSAAAGIQYYYEPTATGFTLKSNTNLAPNTTYTYSYWTAQ